jgi:ubiquinone/menaquinone biosynthesis C-methylase UbiE
MLIYNRIHALVNRLCSDEKTVDKIVNIIMNKYISMNDKMIRISNLYHMYIIDNNIQQTSRNRLYISQKISQYIKAYFFKKIPDVSKLRIMDIGGGNGDVLTNIGEEMNITKRNLFCVEPMNAGWEYLYTNKKDITYVFWDNKTIPNVIKSNSIDVVLIMVSLHHMTIDTRNALFDNLQLTAKPGSLLIIKEHDMQDKGDKFCIEWEHALFAIINNPLTTRDNIKDLRDYYEDYKSKEYWDKYICSRGYIDDTSVFQHNYQNKTYYNPTNLYWKVYIKT